MHKENSIEFYLGIGCVVSNQWRSAITHTVLHVITLAATRMTREATWRILCNTQHYFVDSTTLATLMKITTRWMQHWGQGHILEHTCRSNSITVLQGNLFCIIIQELWRSKKKFRVYCCVFFCVVLFRSRFTIALRGTALGLNANSFKYIVTTQDNFSTQYFTCTRASSPSCEHERVGAVPRKPVSVTSSTVSPIESTRVAFTKDTTMYASKSSERKQPTYNTTKKHTVSACYGNDIKLMI